MVTPRVVEITSQRRASATAGFVPYRRRHPARSTVRGAAARAAGTPRAIAFIAGIPRRRG